MPKKILIIDDEELIIKSLKKVLEKNMYEVLVVKNGQDALIVAEDESFHLIIADIRMPGLNGVETIQSIYDILEKQGKPRTPTIFITGYANDDTEKMAHNLKPIAYLYKPFDINDLLRKINDAVNK